MSAHQKKWLLDINTIRVAQKCAALVQQEYGKRLPLAHSDFVGRMQEYAEDSDSAALKKATQRLAELVEGASEEPPESPEMLDYMGKQYPRFRDGKEFSGLYRGAPVYRENNPHIDP